MLRQIAFGKLHSVLGIEALSQEDGTPNKRAGGSDTSGPAAKVLKTDK